MLLEDGVLIKYDDAFTEILVAGFYGWRRLQISPLEIFQILRDSRSATNRWIFTVNIAGCSTVNLIDQPNNEDLLTELLVPTPTFTGTCDVNPPVLNLKAQMYATVADALEDWPDAENWDWPAY